jgi:poly(3-hydroxybutyrate) depolymerase
VNDRWRILVGVAAFAVACSRAPLGEPSVGGPGGGTAGSVGSGGAGGGGPAGAFAAAGQGGAAATPVGVAGAGGVAGAPGQPPVGINAVLPGPGCGKPLPSGQPPSIPGSAKGYFHYTVQGTGATLAGPQPAKVGPRSFWVRVPPDYDSNRPYRVVYIGQGCGSYDSANNDALQLYKEAAGGTEQAIYVALDIPKDMANMNCYDHRDGPASQEWEAFELFHSVVDANYCVDDNRLYIAGWNTGAWLANMWGCYFAGDGQNPAGSPGVARRFAPRYHIRAQASASGGEPPNNPPCNGPVAAIWIHDASDSATPISASIAGLTRVGAMNGCDTTYDKADIQEPWHPENPVLGAICKRFKGCPADYPVVFCTTNGFGKGDQHERAIPAYKLFFDELELQPQRPPPPCPVTADTVTGATLTPAAFCSNLLATCSDLISPLPAAYSTEAACEATYAASTKQHCQSYHLCGNAVGKTMIERNTHCPHAWGMGPCLP